MAVGLEVLEGMLRAMVHIQLGLLQQYLLLLTMSLVTSSSGENSWNIPQLLPGRMPSIN
jgi:hypothetical protein